MSSIALYHLTAPSSRELSASSAFTESELILPSAEAETVSITDKIITAKTDKKILDNFVQERICDYSFAPPDRRFSDTDFFLPDFNEKDFVSKEVLFMVDTSGSVEDEDLAIVYSEIRGAIEQFAGKLTGKLGFFDAVVTPPLPFECVNDLMNIIPYGGGGTDFFAIFDFIKRNDPEELPACIVIVTDGDAPYPDESDALGIPVLWIINNFICTPPWGRVTRIMPLLTEACEER